MLVSLSHAAFWEITSFLCVASFYSYTILITIIDALLNLDILYDW